MDRAYSPFTIARKYLSYFFTASNGRGHGIHSPFVYDFVRNVLHSNNYPERLKKIELLRAQLKTDRTPVPVEDYGAGNSALRMLKVSTIVKHSAKPAKYGRLLYKLAAYYQPNRIVELGTSFGISTAYLAMANHQTPVLTGEGNDFIAQYAKKNFSALGLSNIQVMPGNFDNILPQLFSGSQPAEFIFIDGNHREVATVHYFEYALSRSPASSVVVFDDIHWSRGMELAWARIKSHPRTLLTIDLFFMGIVFFRPGFKVKQHFTIRY